MLPKLKPPGVDFDFSIISLTVFGPVLGLATTTSGMSISLATGASSLTGSKPVEPGTCGLITSAPVAAIASVSPSGGAFARTVRPSEPPAPGLFST